RDTIRSCSKIPTASASRSTTCPARGCSRRRSKSGGGAEKQLAEDSFGTTPPAALLLGREVIATDVAAGTAELRFQARPDFLNRRGYIQGGMLAAMLDSTLACPLLGRLAPG